MLKLYHTPISFNSRRVWMVLVAKNVEFELVELKLDGDQFNPEFVALNPFHHIPVLVDGDLKVIESLAILDYLEAKYPQPQLLPEEPEALAKTRMVEMVTINELGPVFMQLFYNKIGGEIATPEKVAQQQQQIETILEFFRGILGDNLYFGGATINRADIIAGTIIGMLPALNVSLDKYDKIKAWCQRFQQLPVWKKTEVTPQEVASFIATRKAALENKSKS